MLGTRQHSIFFIALYVIFGLLAVPISLWLLNIVFSLPAFQATIAQIAGIALILLGGCVFSLALIEYIEHEETINPARDPKTLITTGIYKYTRNPLFLASTLIWLGEALVTGAVLVLLFAFFATIINHITLVTIDEKSLKKLFGEKYEKYRRTTPRYIPRLF